MKKIARGYGFFKYGEIVEALCLEGGYLSSEPFDSVDPSKVLIFWSPELGYLRNFILSGFDQHKENKPIYEDIGNYEPCPLNLYKDDNDNHIIIIGIEDGE
jgi:hypothetical protein